MYPKTENVKLKNIEIKWKLENGTWKLENGTWKLENGILEPVSGEGPASTRHRGRDLPVSPGRARAQYINRCI